MDEQIEQGVAGGDGPLRAILYACDIAGFPAPDAAALQALRQPDGTVGGLCVEYELGGPVTLRIVFDEERREYAVRGGMGRVPDARLPAVAPMALKANALLAEDGLCLALDPVADALVVTQTLPADGLDVVEFASRLARLASVAMAWKEHIDGGTDAPAVAATPVAAVGAAPPMWG